MKKQLLAPFVFMAIFLSQGCSDGGINIFTIEDDRQLGLQTKQEIENNPQEFPIVPRSANPKAYAYLDGLRDQILATGTVKYKNEFAWELFIVKKDDVVNAFCTPGGYIYVYTGLIKYLDNASSLAGVMGHEMAHADRRHSTDQLTEQYGLSTLLQVVLGNDPGTLAQLAAGLVSLRFSRGKETEADEYSVKYLCSTKYQETGAANFFIKMLADSNSSQPPQFLSTHPNHENRVQDINATAAKAGCSKDIKFSVQSDIDEYNALKASL
jgi:predicted Zn-dependent protease